MSMVFTQVSKEPASFSCACLVLKKSEDRVTSLFFLFIKAGSFMTAELTNRIT